MYGVLAHVVFSFIYDRCVLLLAFTLVVYYISKEVIKYILVFYAFALILVLLFSVVHRIRGPLWRRRLVTGTRQRFIQP